MLEAERQCSSVRPLFKECNHAHTTTVQLVSRAFRPSGRRLSASSLQDAFDLIESLAVSCKNSPLHLNLNAGGLKNVFFIEILKQPRHWIPDWYRAKVKQFGQF